MSAIYRLVLNSLELREYTGGVIPPGYRRLTLAHVPRLLSISPASRQLLKYARERTFGPSRVRVYDGTIELITDACRIDIDQMARCLQIRSLQGELPDWATQRPAVVSSVADGFLTSFATQFFNRESTND